MAPYSSIIYMCVIYVYVICVVLYSIRFFIDALK